VHVLKLLESTPAFGIYSLAEVRSGAIVDAPDTGSWLTGNGYPLVPEGEIGLGQWILQRSRLYGYFDAEGRGSQNPHAGDLTPHLMARGSLALRITDRALRLSVLDGKSPELGKFNAGRQVGFRPLHQNRVRTLSCVWRLEDVWAMDTPHDTGAIRRLRLGGPNGACLLIGRVIQVQESFLKSGMPLAGHTGDLADQLIDALIQHALASDSAERMSAADEVAAARRDSGRPLGRIARFRRRPGTADDESMGGPQDHDDDGQDHDDHRDDDHRDD
jgi:hypothetical protein